MLSMYRGADEAEEPILMLSTTAQRNNGHLSIRLGDGRICWHHVVLKDSDFWCCSRVDS